MTDEIRKDERDRLTAIYNEANNISKGQRIPVSTESVFKAMLLAEQKASRQSEINALRLALETEHAVATDCAKRMAHWIEKFDALKAELAAHKAGEDLALAKLRKADRRINELDAILRIYRFDEPAFRSDHMKFISRVDKALERKE